MKTRRFEIFKGSADGRFQSVADETAAEEPLEIVVEGRPVAVVMRTPGNDRELVAGFLLSEGIIGGRGDLFDITGCGDNPEGNRVEALLARPGEVNLEKLTRHVFTSSSCGVCGKATMDAVLREFPAAAPGPGVAAATIAGLPERLRAGQAAFAATGGLHACALFDARGEPLAVREDVGRHNAVDKILGWALWGDALPLREHILMVSGRTSFEILQKALAAGIPMVAAISAPSSLAVEFARRNGQTLIGFLRGNRMNVYAHPERIFQPSPDQR